MNIELNDVKVRDCLPDLTIEPMPDRSLDWAGLINCCRAQVEKIILRN